MSDESTISRNREAFQKMRDEYFLIYIKSQEEFENKFTLVTTAAFGGSVFLIEKVVPNLKAAEHKWALYACWTTLGSSLLLNLLSHLISARNLDKSIQELDTNRYNHEVNNSRWNIIKSINWICYGLILLGISFLTIFSILNLNT